MFKKLSKGIKNLLDKEGHKSEGHELMECEIFSSETLMDATHNFHPRYEIGQGDTGSIYKGKLKDGRDIVVKKLSDISEIGISRFLIKIRLLSSLNHRNVVRLVGYCASTHKNKYFLVYEYVSYGTLDKLLFNSRMGEGLNWTQRYNIIVGVAKGLSYLHGGSQNGIIIHRHIKANNILIDDKWNPKIIGFGLGCQFLEDETPHIITQIVGTRGYIAPEYCIHGHLSVKIDVFSFGILVLELISGEHISIMLEDNELGMLDWAHKLHNEDRSIEMMDHSLGDSAVIEEVKKCITIGLLCTQGDPVLRPDMDFVVSMLMGKQVHTGMPISGPSFYNDDRSFDGYECEEAGYVAAETLYDAARSLLGREGRKDEVLVGLASHQRQIISYEILLAATNNFNPRNEISRRSDYPYPETEIVVYKGTLKDGREVAVKKFVTPSGDERASLMKEIELLSRLNHCNLLKFVGYCAHKNEYFLVFEYVPDTLDNLLFSPIGKEKLKWTERYKIIQGIAKGLDYLHGGSQNGIIIHRDIKPGSIFIDHQLKPIIGRIGGGRQCPEDQTHLSTDVFGTMGYIAPEYFMSGTCTAKGDAYSFGILVLELITGKRNVRYSDNSEHLAESAHKLYDENRSIELMDPILEDSAVIEEVTNCIKIGLLCTQYDPSRRPDMDCVLSMLTTNHVPVRLEIDRPGYSNHSDSECPSFQSDEYEVAVYNGGESPEYMLAKRHQIQDSPSNSNQIMQEDPHSDSFQSHESEVAVYNGGESPEHMLARRHQIQDSPSNSNQIMQEDPHSDSFRVQAQHDSVEHEDENLENKITAQNCQKFSYETLYDATNEFASQNVLGQGGFGIVYKGKLDDGREIAVKKSSGISEQHKKSLIREVELLSRVKHPNVVKLLGYCSDDNNFLLVYEFVLNNSLNKLLFGPNGREQELDWALTYSIIVGIAKGLSYLHADPQNCIIHRDIKGGNILLHHKWVPKIADFGISRLFDADQTHVYTGAVGTLGYIAPEYLDHGHVSVKIDVYSFGVLVLELISGKRCSFMPPPEDNAIGLLDWVYKLFKASRISDIMDPALADSAVIEQVANCIEIGLRCTQGDPRLRPKMEHVVIMLTANECHKEISICRPGIYGYRGYRSSRLSAFAEATQSDESGEVSEG